MKRYSRTWFLHQTVREIESVLTEGELMMFDDRDIKQIAETVDADSREIPLDAKIQEAIVHQTNKYEELYNGL